MNPTLTCTRCQVPVTEDGGKYCSHCGAALVSPARTAPQGGSHTAQQPAYNTTFINVVRLLSAAAMFSAMFAVIQFDSTTAQGRVLIVLGVLTASCGQLFVMQATKTQQPAWVQVPLTLLGAGVVAVIVAWVMALS